jgi:transcriptional regulator with XRE-family HTH domain
VRQGKMVTQEEVAEAIGVSRVWYAMLESGAALRTSSRLLARLADVLSLSDESREVLFKLALPELSIGGNTFATVKDLSGSIAPLRVAARRVWNATSESEILVTIAEAITGIFGDSDFVGAFNRIEPGHWEFPVLIGGEHVQNSLAEVQHTLTDGVTPAQLDESMLYGVLTDPGQVGTRHELHRNLAGKHRIDRAFTSVGFGDINFLKAHLKSREGFEATIFAAYALGKKDFTELDRDLLGTLAALASLALSRQIRPNQ